MADTHDAGAVGHHPSPTAMYEDPTRPAMISQNTEVEDFSKRQPPQTADQSTDMAERAPREPLQQQAESYFDVDPAQAQPVNASSVEPIDDIDNVPQPAPPRRTITAPAHGARRRAPFSSMPLAGTKRRATGVNDQSQDPYSYTFDPLSSDSDSSSSEDELPQTKSRSDGQQQQSDGSGDQTTQERRKQAKSGKSYSRFKLGNEHFKTKGRISKRDGRLNISINETANSGYIAKALGQSIKHHLNVPARHERGHADEEAKFAQEEEEAGSDAESVASSLRQIVSRPRLNIVIMVIGSRGDIQPFVKVAKILKEQHGHRVRVASHPTFRKFVQEENGLEFFSVGGDPSELMAFMVKNPGLIPSLQTLREGEIQRRRAAMGVMFEGFWRACINTTDDEKDKENLKMMGDKSPFVADAIIANPPSMAHVHIAEKLGIPLHVMFTFPYSPTQAFPHPLANIKAQKSNVDAHYVNFMSYPLVEMMTWQGLGDIVNRFRERTLGLEPVSSLWAPGALYRMKVPYTYMWSPSLVPKPKDWGPEIDIAGFVFLEQASTFTPDKELEDFLNAGEPPVYIGFGSIVVDDPNAFTEMIFKATEMAGVRALVNKGWGGLGQDNKNTPSHIHMLGNTPHDWLFPKVKAVVHHGGAGTTAIGLKCGKPTMIVPFFGDQPFWGAMVAEAKAGAHQCIPYKRLTVERLAEGIKQCLTEEAQINVQKIAESILKEGDGAENAVKSFHRSLPLAGRHSMRCSILEDRAAVWQLRKSSLRLSALAAELLHEKGKIDWNDLKLLRHYEWNDFDGPGEPITGTVGAMTESLHNIGGGVGMVPVRIAKHVKKHEEHQKKRQARQKRREERLERKAAQAAARSNPSTEQAETEAPAVSQQNQRPQAAREETNTTIASTMSEASEPLPVQVAEDVGWGFKRSGGALLTMPNDLHVAIAQGFHNAPRLWGDATVRKPVRITGFKSGCVAARKEFVYGVWDGWTGLVMHPVGDWKDADTIPAKFAGLGKGFGKGMGGLVLKNVSAVVAPPAYIGKGFIKYVEKKSDGNPGSKTFIRKAHIIQGQKDVRALRAQDTEGKEQQLRLIHERVDEGWKVYQDIWETAHEHYGSVGGNLVGKYKLRREKKTWDVNGALENVNTANRALRARKQGDNVEKLFAKRRREMREAERPRLGAMEQPDVPEEVAPGDALPEGVESSYAPPKEEAEKAGIEEEEAEDDEEEGREEDSSDATAVATPDDEHDDKQAGRKSSVAEQTKFQGKDTSLPSRPRMANRGMVSV